MSLSLPERDGLGHPGVRYLDLDGAAGSRRVYACTRLGRQAWRANVAVVAVVAVVAALAARPALGRG